jgi:CelD/BcsL family acetyltransferase involved in cellulose biosynthesis
MSVRAVSQTSELLPYQVRWNELAGDCPFRSWTWLTTWWKHYGNGCELEVLLVFDDSEENTNQPIGILPAYVETTHTQGKVLRLLGDGEVCSEHLDLLAEPTRREQICRDLADYLVSHADSWDSMKFAVLAEHERSLGQLIEELTFLSCTVHRSSDVNLWAIPLPDSWEEFLAMQSKSHRKQLRQLRSRVLDTPRAMWKPVHDQNQFHIAWEQLIDLHQCRRLSLGEPGCFASPVWSNFHREVATELLERGQLRLSVLELAGSPIAAEYHLAGVDATYAYQGGINPDRCDEEPGQLSMMLCVEQAIADGHKRFELLRGDEPYKAHWRAEPTATVCVDVVAPRTLARLRHLSWNGARQAGRFVRQFTNLLG